VPAGDRIDQLSLLPDAEVDPADWRAAETAADGLRARFGPAAPRPARLLPPHGQSDRPGGRHGSPDGHDHRDGASREG
jgi:DNA polymerase IV